MRRLARPGGAFLSAIVLVTQIGFVAPASAEGASVPAARDLVKLHDGSLYRGTIIEFVPHDHVTLQLVTGAVRRFAMANVEYEGDAANQPRVSAVPPAPPLPPTPPAPAPEDAAGVPVRVVANDADVSLLVERSLATVGSLTAKGYGDICIAPCAAALPAGTYRMALSSHGGRAVEVQDAVHIDAPATLKAQYESHRDARTLGIVVTAVGGVAGIALIVGGMLNKNDCPTAFSGQPACTSTPSPDIGLISGGFATMAVSGLIGLAFILQHDHATVQVVPLQDAFAVRPGTTRKEAPPARDTQGLALRVAY
jgi:hypothetical protein